MTEKIPLGTLVRDLRGNRSGRVIKSTRTEVRVLWSDGGRTYYGREVFLGMLTPRLRVVRPSDEGWEFLA
jgi:hypothetical protein